MPHGLIMRHTETGGRRRCACLIKDQAANRELDLVADKLSSKVPTSLPLLEWAGYGARSCDRTIPICPSSVDPRRRAGRHAMSGSSTSPRAAHASFRGRYQDRHKQGSEGRAAKLTRVFAVARCEADKILNVLTRTLVPSGTSLRRSGSLSLRQPASMRTTDWRA